MKDSRRHGGAAWLVVLGLMVLAACAAPGGAFTSARTLPTPTSMLAATQPGGDLPADTPTATAGPPCSGGRWGGVAASAGANIPLPPQTVTGPREYIPSGSWTGTYTQLCTSGNQQTIDTFVQQQLPAAGWSLTAPPGDCVCNGLPVWSRPNDGRLVQFDAHPNLYAGSVRWSVTIFTRP